jgi:hypothetical protein
MAGYLETKMSRTILRRKRKEKVNNVIFQT